MSSTHLRLPDSLPYPITITSIVAQPSTSITRGTPLLNYSFDYASKQPETDNASQSNSTNASKKAKLIGTWEASVDGTIESWTVAAGTRMTRQDAQAKPVVSVLEECSHPMQISGMCAVCGKDTTLTDYMSISDESRASIRMTHDAAGPTVSMAEAQRIEKETAQRLLDSRKLILIVDLDQTIVHATVDPTVGEWIAEGEGFEKRQAKRQAKKGLMNGTGQATPAPTTAAEAEPSSDSDEGEEEGEVNPNWTVLKDVVRFKLGPDMPPSSNRRGAPAESSDGGCDYFIKPRPGLSTFLAKLKEKYEMHVYTMGTRAYALKVCNAIDPSGDFFNERILTRDESGSMTSKSIERLFPYNNSMVVVIDDRADVWNYSPNLVKVIPYDFFVGIGDINATYLPKSPDPLGETSASAPLSSLRSVSSDSATPNIAASNHTTGDLPPSNEIDATKAETVSAIVTQAQTQAVAAQLEERPLAKAQEALEADSINEADGKREVEEDDEATTASANRSHDGSSTDDTAKTGPHPKTKALLNNDDKELERVWDILDTVHGRFFVAHERRKSNSGQRTNGKGKEKGSLNRSDIEPDIKAIIPSIKSEILVGVQILFSSVIPLGTPPTQSEAWRYARDFGARCHTQFSDDVTHVVTAKEGTEKVLKAFQRQGIKVVWAKWFQDCVALWKHLDESGDYLVPAPSKKTMGKLERSATPSASLETRPAEDIGTPSAAMNSEANTEEAGTPVALDLDWAAAQDELDAFLDEDSDDDIKEDGEEGDDEADAKGDPREGLGREFQDQDMDALFAEAEEDPSYAGSNAVASSSGPTAQKRRRSTVGSPSNSTATSGTEDEDANPPQAKRKRLSLERNETPPIKKQVTVADDESDSDDGEDDDEAEEGMGKPASKQPSASSSSSSQSGGEEGGEEDDIDIHSEDSGDDDFAAALSNEEGWG